LSGLINDKFDNRKFTVFEWSKFTPRFA
jgi:hypothetical protein